MEVKSVTKTVIEYLRGQIISGELAPGQKLNENFLSTSLDISRPPIREAFRVLEYEHLIVYIPRKGSYVREVSVDDLKQVYQARKMIECFAIDCLKDNNIRKLPKATLALSQAEHMSRQSTDDSQQLLLSREKIVDFHVKMVEACNNVRIINFYWALYYNLARYQYMYFSIPGRIDRSLIEHHQILDSIRNGAYEQAKELLKAHIQYVFSCEKDILEGKQSRGT